MAFQDCTGLTSVVIGNSVTSIEYSAFSRCSSLTSVTIPDSVTSIGKHVFWQCYDLTSVIIGNSVTSIGEGAFIYCSSLTSINIPDSVTSIGKNAFSECSSLTSVTIGNSVTSIGESAFKSCTGLTSINIPDSVTIIGEWAFQSCTSLTNVTIGNSVTSIGYNAFQRCTSLMSINIPDSVTIIGEWAFQSCTSLTNVTIGNSVTSIGYNAFYHCSSLTSINIPDSVISIGSDAFYECTNLTEINIPSGVDTIQSYTFQSCYNLQDIYIDRSEITFEDGWNNGSPEAYIHYNTCTHTIEKLPEEGLRIEDVSNNVENGNIGCRQTYSFKILDENDNIITDKRVAVKQTGTYPSNYESTEVVTPNDEGIYSVVIKNNTAIQIGVRNGEKYQATDENGITWNYTYQDGEAINVYYENGNIEGKVEIPAYLDGYPVIKICNNTGYAENIFVKGTYDSNYSVTEIVIPNTVKIIGEYALYNCNNISEINIPSSVTRIEYNAFSYNAELFIDNEQENVSINSDRYNIHYKGCTHNVNFVIDPREHIKIENVTNNVIDGKIECKGIYSFKILDEENEVIKDKTIKVEKSKKNNSSYESRIELQPDENGVYTIEDIRREITIRIGADNGEISTYTDEKTGITYEYTYEDGKARALKFISGDLEGIETLELPDKVDGLVITTLAEEAFKGQTGFKNVILPDSITCIGVSSFEGCISLETVVLPDGLQVIPNAAFKGCSSLEQIELPDSLLAIGNEAFSGCSSLRLSKGLKNVKAIGEKAFEDCTSLTGTLTLPGEIVQIGNEAYSGCTGIEKIVISAYKGEIKLDSSSIMQNSANMSINGANIDNSFMNSISFATNTMNNIVMTDENGDPVKDENGNNVILIERDEEGNPILDESGNYIPLSITKTMRNLRIGDNAFSGCSNLKELVVNEAINALDANVISQCPSLTDVYISNTKADMEEELEAPEGVYVHYLDTRYEVEVDELEETSIESISGINEDGTVRSSGTYKFKVNIAEGSTLKGVIVKVGNRGEEKEVIVPDENGVYTIKNVIRDQEITIEEGRIVEVRYELEDGSKIAKSTILAGEEGTSYTTTAKEIENYKWNGQTPENAEGIFSQEDTVVTYVYEKIPSGVITVKYVDKDGGNIIDPIEVQGYIGDKYEILRKNIKGYKAYGVTPENAKGTYTAEDMEVVFVYEKIEEETVIKYVDTDGNYIARDKTVYEDEETEQEAKDIEGYEKTGKTEEGKEITYTYEEAKTKTNKWGTQQTLLAIAGIIAVLVVIFIIIAKKEKKDEEE